MIRRFPRGIWFEKTAGRFRVRLYRNGVSYLKGYYPTLELALEALQKLKDHLDTVPKLPRNFVKQTPMPTFASLSKSIQQDAAPRLT